MARECPNATDDMEDRGGYKRQRRDDNQNSFRGQNEGWDQSQTNFGAQDAQRQSQDGWNNQGSNSGWGQ